jgi:O-antigen ligase
MVLAIAPTLGHVCGLVEASWERCGRRWSSWLLWLARPEAGRLALLGLCAITMATALVLTGSRSGVVSLAVVLAVLGYRAVRRSEQLMPKIAAIVAAAAVFVGALAWGRSKDLASKVGRLGHDESIYGRLQVWHDALHIFRDFPILGSGMGTFGDVMVVYQSGSRVAAYTQAHNDYLQILAEGGAAMAAAAIGVMVAIGAGAAFRLRRDTDLVTNWIRYGAVAGLIGIGVQSIVEFSLQMPGVAVLFVVVAAIALHRPPDRTAHAHRM